MLWANEGGAVYCTKHLGRQATWALERTPNAKTLQTDLDRWEQAGGSFPCERCPSETETETD